MSRKVDENKLPTSQLTLTTPRDPRLTAQLPGAFIRPAQKELTAAQSKQTNKYMIKPVLNLPWARRVCRRRRLVRRCSAGSASRCPCRRWAGRRKCRERTAPGRDWSRRWRRRAAARAWCARAAAPAKRRRTADPKPPTAPRSTPSRSWEMWGKLCKMRQDFVEKKTD